VVPSIDGDDGFGKNDIIQQGWNFRPGIILIIIIIIIIIIIRQWWWWSHNNTISQPSHREECNKFNDGITFN
jgi:hypothetical protein